AVEAAGARGGPLPGYSPHPTPVEEVGSKGEAVLRSVAARPTPTVMGALGTALGPNTPSDNRGWVQHPRFFSVPLSTPLGDCPLIPCRLLCQLEACAASRGRFSSRAASARCPLGELAHGYPASQEVPSLEPPGLHDPGLHSRRPPPRGRPRLLPARHRPPT